MAQTVVDTREDPCGAATDIVFRQVDLGPSTLGDTKCLKRNDVNRCDQWRIRVNVNLIDATATNSGSEIRHTLCHEIGHTVGLWHYGFGDPYTGPADRNGADNCLMSGLADGGQPWTRSYGPHDIVAVNTNW
ncbi:hypothetical protein ACFQ3F_08255 [Nocardioides ginsengisoli]|uniref:Peptidase M10 metallopeptidase domain-containing protein n=2 Tax=Nocardioides ginsengisoli TaxID=363868 RepID=A0ABW3VZZ4_9ACTN